jgi:hypothetical protein
VSLAGVSGLKLVLLEEETEGSSCTAWATTISRDGGCRQWCFGGWRVAEQSEWGERVDEGKCERSSSGVPMLEISSQHMWGRQ